MHILTVCTGNVCRSPAAATLLLEDLPHSGSLSVTSAGVAAPEDMPGCPVMTELVRSRLGGAEPRDHSSRLLTGDMLRSADLILVADHSHLADIGRLVPSVAPRSFTLRIAAQLAATVVSRLPEHMPVHTPALVEPAHLGQGQDGSAYDSPGRATLSPAGAVDQRLQWLVAEMNEIRGVAAPTVPQPRHRAPLLRRRRDEPETPASDVPDPHACYRDIHREAFILLSAAVDTFTSSVRDLLAR